MSLRPLSRALSWPSRLAVGFVTLCACESDDLSREVVLAEVADELEVVAFVLGTADPATIHGLQVTLTAGSRDDEGELICPVLDVSASVNGISLEQTGHGGAVRGSSDVIGDESGCRPIQLHVALADEDELDDDETVLVIEDDSGSVELRAMNLFAAPSAVLEGDALVAGQAAELAILPDPAVLPVELELTFSGESSAQSFSYRLAGQTDSELELTEGGLRFEVPEIDPGRGTLVVTGIGHVDAFRGKVTRCNGAASCTVLRAACASASCSSAASVPTGFDRIALEVSVAVPPGFPM